MRSASFSTTLPCLSHHQPVMHFGIRSGSLRMSFGLEMPQEFARALRIVQHQVAHVVERQRNHLADDPLLGHLQLGHCRLTGRCFQRSLHLKLADTHLGRIAVDL
ncbi:hypothetical protein CAL15_14945 [Bordetella genomosp. 13]|uniref:Uncharacterized protein n=1 Tax=Bordetella genomosp. 13 TaxID=463040 RepID=A0A1W6ZE76_9BORD|nr:hypothetical protein CAL15_14945 [Bordetella genomosp. 13]